MAVEYDFMAGLQTGFTLDYFLTDRLSMRGELLFSQTGARTQKNYGDLSVKNLQVNYLNLPLLFKVKSIKNLFFTGGGVGGFRISKDILDFTGFNRLDFALAGGVGYDFNRNCGFEFRYNHGVMAVGSTPILYNEKTVGSFATHSRCFQLAVEYRLATKRF